MPCSACHTQELAQWGLILNRNCAKMSEQNYTWTGQLAACRSVLAAPRWIKSRNNEKRSMNCCLGMLWSKFNSIHIGSGRAWGYFGLAESTGGFLTYFNDTMIFLVKLWKVPISLHQKAQAMCSILLSTRDLP